MIRAAMSWGLFLLGDLIWRIFEWTGFGLRGPLYGIYNRLMIWSAEVQGDGHGPWGDYPLT